MTDSRKEDTMNEMLIQFNELVGKLLEEENKQGIAPYVPTKQLQDTIDLSLDDEGTDLHDFNDALEELTLSTPRTSTNLFFNQLFGGRRPDSILGDLLAVILNNSMYTYKAAGAQVGAEKVIIQKLLGKIGWSENGEGTIAPGGSMTNFMAMLMARDRCDSAIKGEGVNTKMCVYTSKESHYSIAKNASFAGIGREQVRYVQSNAKGEMDCAHLEQLIIQDIKEDNTPFLVNATAGTTVLGAFDDINKLSPICKKYKLWLHVDGAYCGAVLLSHKYKSLISGIEKADSFSFNAHKMLGTPLSCSIILTQHQEYLYHSFSNDASYLYQTDGDEFNLGKISLQCGRRNDALKLWTLWKRIGTNGLEQLINHQFYLADIARDYVQSNQDYTLYSFENSISVCFNYKNIPAKKICTLLYEHEKLMVGYGSFQDKEFIRLVTINADNSKEDILHLFKVIENFVDSKPELFSVQASIG